jgi:hypothetical protein
MYIIILSFLFITLLPLSSFAEGTFSERIYLTKTAALTKGFGPTPHSLNTLTIPTTDRRLLKKQSGLSFQDSTIHFYKNKTGTAFILDELGKYYPITLFIKISPEGKVVQTHVMVYRERIGSGVRKSRFLKQFIGRTRQDKLMVDRDINGISGATISSWAVSTAVKKALFLADYIETHEKTTSH